MVCFPGPRARTSWVTAIRKAIELEAKNARMKQSEFIESTEDFNAGILRISLGRKVKMIKRPEYSSDVQDTSLTNSSSPESPVPSRQTEPEQKAAVDHANVAIAVNGSPGLGHTELEQKSYEVTTLPAGNPPAPQLKGSTISLFPINLN